MAGEAAVVDAISVRATAEFASLRQGAAEAASSLREMKSVMAEIERSAQSAAGAMAAISAAHISVSNSADAAARSQENAAEVSAKAAQKVADMQAQSASRIEAIQEASAARIEAIQAEAAAREQSLAEASAARIGAIQAEGASKEQATAQASGARLEAIKAESYARQEAQDALYAQRMAAIRAEAAAKAEAIAQASAARIEAIQAEAVARLAAKPPAAIAEPIAAAVQAEPTGDMAEYAEAVRRAREEEERIIATNREAAESWERLEIELYAKEERELAEALELEARAADQANQAMRRHSDAAAHGAHSSHGFWSELKAGFAYSNPIDPWMIGMEAVEGVNMAFSKLAEGVQDGMATLDKASHTGLELAAVFQGDKHAIDDMLASAQQLSSGTPFFTDRQVAQAEATERLFGLNADQIKRLTPELMDLAAVMGTDVDTAAQKVGLALEGQTRGLKAWGINVAAGSDTQTVLNAILQKAAQFHEQAAAAADTYAGKMAEVKKRSEEANQALAQVLLPTVLKIENAFIGAEEAVTRFLRALQGMPGAEQNRYANLASQILDYGSALSLDSGKTVTTYDADAARGPGGIAMTRTEHESKFKYAYEQIAAEAASGGSLADLLKTGNQFHLPQADLDQIARLYQSQGFAAPDGGNALTHAAHAGVTGGHATHTSPQNPGAAAKAAAAARRHAADFMQATDTALNGLSGDTPEGVEAKMALLGDRISQAMKTHVLPQADLNKLNAKMIAFGRDFAKVTDAAARADLESLKKWGEERVKFGEHLAQGFEQTAKFRGAMAGGGIRGLDEELAVYQRALAAIPVATRDGAEIGKRKGLEGDIGSVSAQMKIASADKIRQIDEKLQTDLLGIGRDGFVGRLAQLEAQFSQEEQQWSKHADVVAAIERQKSAAIQQLTADTIGSSIKGLEDFAAGGISRGGFDLGSVLRGLGGLMPAAGSVAGGIVGGVAGAGLGFGLGIMPGMASGALIGGAAGTAAAGGLDMAAAAADRASGLAMSNLQIQEAYDRTLREGQIATTSAMRAGAGPTSGLLQGAYAAVADADRARGLAALGTDNDAKLAAEKQYNAAQIQLESAQQQVQAAEQNLQAMQEYKTSVERLQEMMQNANFRGQKAQIEDAMTTGHLDKITGGKQLAAIDFAAANAGSISQILSTLTMPDKAHYGAGDAQALLNAAVKDFQKGMSASQTFNALENSNFAAMEGTGISQSTISALFSDFIANSADMKTSIDRLTQQAALNPGQTPQNPSYTVVVNFHELGAILDRSYLMIANRPTRMTGDRSVAVSKNAPAVVSPGASGGRLGTVSGRA